LEGELQAILDEQFLGISHPRFLLVETVWCSSAMAHLV